DNQNYLANAVLDRPPHPRFMVNALFDNRVELIGYDLALPHGDTIGPGERFTITWYFHSFAQVPGRYQPFVPIDGRGQRLNGAHPPVDGRSPLQLWQANDYVVDRQELSVPMNYPRGDLTIFMGFYQGENRLEVVRGPKDDVNRVRAGVLRVR